MPALIVDHELIAAVVHELISNRKYDLVEVVLMSNKHIYTLYMSNEVTGKCKCTLRTMYCDSMVGIDNTPFDQYYDVAI